MLRNDTRNIAMVIYGIDTVITSTKPQGTIVSVVCLLEATRYQGKHDRNQPKGQSRIHINIVFL